MARRLSFVVATLAIALLYQCRTAPSAGGSLDESWKAVIGHDLLEGRQFGVETVFTYGPFGYFLVDEMPYIPKLYPVALLMHWVLGIGAAAVLLAASRAVRPWPLQAIWFAAMILLALSLRETVHLAALGLIPTAFAAARRPTLPALLCAVLYASLLAFSKHTLLFEAAIVLPCTLGIVARRRGAKVAAVATLIVAAAPLLVWLGARQDPRNLPVYWETAVDLVVHYPETMALDESMDVQLVTIGTGLALGLACCASLFARREGRRDVAVALATIAILVTGAIATKSGLIRVEVGHRTIASGALLFLGLAMVSQGSRVAHVFRAAAVCGAAVGFVMANPTFGFFIKRVHVVLWDHVVAVTDEWVHPGDSAAKHDLLRSRLAEATGLLDLRARIGSETIDVVGVEQGLLYLSGMNLRHRPVFQDYAVFSPALNARNAAFFAGPDAPRFVSVSMFPIDRRYPAISDSASLRAVLLRYKPVESGRGFALFEREDASDIPDPTRARSLTPAFGETIALDDAAPEVSLEIEPSLLGRVLSLASRPPFYEMVVTLGPEGERRFRVSPSLARAPFILTPFVNSPASFFTLAEGGDRKRVTAIRFEVEKGRESWVEDRLGVTFWTDEPLRRRIRGRADSR